MFRNNLSDRFHVIALTAILAVIFVLFGIYMEEQKNKVNYYLYLAGNDIDKNHRALIQILSRDGYMVTTADVSINNKRVDSSTIEITGNIKNIDVKIGGENFSYEVNHQELIERSKKPILTSGFTDQDIENGKNALKMTKIGPKELFVLPATFRMTGEFATKVFFFCFENGGVCKDTKFYAAGHELKMADGIAETEMTMPPDNKVKIAFDDGSAGEFSFPYAGKMFMITEKEMKKTVYTLSDSKTVHVDCFYKGIWYFSDIVSVKFTGVVLPENYDFCDRIQLSYNSSDPGGSFFVLTKDQSKGVQVKDPYYTVLRDRLASYLPDSMPEFLRIYSASEFFRLNTIFSGLEYEKKFDGAKASKLSIFWWIIAFISIFESLYFGYYIHRRFHVVKDDEGETITFSHLQKKVMLVVVTSIPLAFFMLFLFILKRLS